MGFFLRKMCLILSVFTSVYYFNIQELFVGESSLYILKIYPVVAFDMDDTNYNGFSRLVARIITLTPLSDQSPEKRLI